MTTQIVQSVCYQLLSRAALTMNQDRSLGGSDLSNLLKEPLHPRMASDEKLAALKFDPSSGLRRIRPSAESDHLLLCYGTKTG